MSMLNQIIQLKQVVIENKDLLYKSGITIFASAVSRIEMIDSWVRLGVSIIGLIVGILTIIKLIRELWVKNKKKDER